MKRLTRSLLLLCLLVPALAEAATAPPSWNNFRIVGQVSQANFSEVNGVSFGNFEVHVGGPAQGMVAHVECPEGQATALGCGLLRPQDWVVVYGHLDERLSCAHDGVDSRTIANLVYRCTAQPPSTCLLISQ
jgi:hypothetical protein